MIVYKKSTEFVCDVINRCPAPDGTNLDDGSVASASILLQISRSTLLNMKRGDSSPTVEQVQRWARLLQMGYVAFSPAAEKSP